MMLRYQLETTSLRIPLSVDGSWNTCILVFSAITVFIFFFCLLLICLFLFMLGHESIIIRHHLFSDLNLPHRIIGSGCASALPVL